MPINRELISSPWPEGMTSKEIRKVLAEGNKRKKEKPVQVDCSISSGCSATIHTLGCPRLKG